MKNSMGILDLLEQDSFNPTRKASTSGGEFACGCPWCGGKDRFRIWPEQSRYWCRGCNRKGDGIQYLRDYRNLSFIQACDLLGRERGMKAVRHQGNKPEWQPQQAEEPSEIWQEYMEKFTLWAANNLWSGVNEHATDFLRTEKNLNNETSQGFLIGWNPRDLYVPKEKLNLEICDRDFIKLPSGIVIPYADEDGIHRVRIRCFNGKPRYYIVKGSSSMPMLIGGGDGAVILVESELDAFLLHQECEDIASVIAMGSASKRPDIRTHQFLNESQLILVSLDTDDAGAKQYWQWWRRYFPNAKRWPVINGKDPGEAVKNGLDLRNWVTAGIGVKQ